MACNCRKSFLFGLHNVFLLVFYEHVTLVAYAVRLNENPLQSLHVMPGVLKGSI